MSRRVIEYVSVTKIGYSGAVMRFHPSHDMGSLHCWQCGVNGFDLPSNPDRRKAMKLCPRARNPEGIGL